MKLTSSRGGAKLQCKLDRGEPKKHEDSQASQAWYAAFPEFFLMGQVFARGSNLEPQRSSAIRIPENPLFLESSLSWALEPGCKILMLLTLALCLV